MQDCLTCVVYTLSICTMLSGTSVCLTYFIYFRAQEDALLIPLPFTLVLYLRIHELSFALIPISFEFLDKASISVGD